MSSPASTRNRTTATQSSPSAAQSTDAFTQWMDTVIPLAHHTPADTVAQADDTEEEVAAAEKDDDEKADSSDVQPYVAINPSLLHDTRWSYRDLQLLCQRLGLGGSGDRTHLIHKLRTWNRTHFSSGATHPQPNTAASNFALLCISSNTSSGSAQLTPLKVRTPRLCDGSPRSALSGGRGVSVRSEGRRLSFSVFNGVKIIPPRTLQYNDEEEEVETESEEKVTGEPQQQSATSKEAATVEACQNSDIAAKGKEEQSVVDVAQAIAQQSRQFSKANDETVKQQATDEAASAILRRSGRKRMPSRKLRESQL